jgi:ATP-dependent DNA helicase RecG
MLSNEEILGLIPSGEGYNAEFKIRVPSKLKELAEEVCAFANAAGGVLLLGIGDDNEIHGISIDYAKRSAIQNSFNEITPHIYCPLYQVHVNGREV